MLKSISTSIILLIFNALQAQVTIETADLKNFYIAFDSIQATSDTLKQKYYLTTFYFDKASSGLKSFIKLHDREGGLDANTLLPYVLKNKEKLSKNRLAILSVEKQKPKILKKIKYYKKLYPEFKEGTIIYVVGREIFGGKPLKKDLFIGAEVMANDKNDWSIPMVLHEYTHTQQWFLNNIEQIFAKNPQFMPTVLANAIWEGHADFMAEFTYGKPLEMFYTNHYNAFGYAHEKEIWAKFKEEMFAPVNDNKQWFYRDKDFNGLKVRDIGYFMGNQLCKSYYKKTKDKKAAITHMMNLKLDTLETAFQFLKDSGYATENEILELEKKIVKQ
jgi:hypothetical protein